jgi:hypothetical protein
MRMRPLPDMRQVRHHPQYAPRFRERLRIERQLADDAASAARIARSTGTSASRTASEACSPNSARLATRRKLLPDMSGMPAGLAQPVTLTRRLLAPG